MSGIKQLYKRIFKKQPQKEPSLVFNYTNGVEYARSKGVKIGENCRCYTSTFGSEPI